MTKHLLRTLFALACLGFLGLVGLYVGYGCDVSELSCKKEGEKTIELPAVIGKILDLVN